MRLLYLKDIWGLPQETIAEIEGLSQPRISRKIADARRQHSDISVKHASQIHWTEDEIKGLQMLPREIIGDVPLVAFINNILNVNVNHPFYQLYDNRSNIRIAALHHLGIQNKRICQIFDKSYPTVTMAIQRNIDRVEKLEKDTRYNFTNYHFSISHKTEEHKQNGGFVFGSF